MYTDKLMQAVNGLRAAKTEKEITDLSYKIHDIISEMVTGKDRGSNDIASEIMNIPIAKKVLAELPCMDSELCYKMGHRDARHKAAEIVLKHWHKLTP